jgi:intracellular septation protein
MAQLETSKEKPDVLTARQQKKPYRAVDVIDAEFTEVPRDELSPTSSGKPSVGRFLKLALEVGPLAVFFITNGRFGIFYATASFMAATLISLVTSRIFLKRIPVLALVTGVFVMIFGFLTIYLHDDTFIKIKPTVVNTLFAFILAAGLYFRRPVLKLALGEILQMREEGWRVLTLRWIGFFLFLAVLNEVVWRNFSTDTWVSFKSFGLMPLTFFFMMFQITLIMRHQISEVSSES